MIPICQFSVNLESQDKKRSASILFYALERASDPHAPNANLAPICSYGQSPAQAEWAHKEWLKSKVIDRPKATEMYTVKQLEEMGIVGIYEVIPDEH